MTFISVGVVRDVCGYDIVRQHTILTGPSDFYFRAQVALNRRGRASSPPAACAHSSWRSGPAAAAHPSLPLLLRSPGRLWGVA